MVGSCADSQRAQTNFFSQIQSITQTAVIECATKFLLSDVLQYTNMNNDCIDFWK